MMTKEEYTTFFSKKLQDISPVDFFADVTKLLLNQSFDGNKYSLFATLP